MRRDDQAYTLANNASATGSAVQIQGGEYIFMAEGTPGGSTISLQIEMSDGTFCDITALNSNTAVRTTTLPYSATPITLPAGSVRMAATGGTPSGINATLVGIG